MRKQFTKIALAATLGFALTLTLGCEEKSSGKTEAEVADSRYPTAEEAYMAAAKIEAEKVAAEQAAIAAEQAAKKAAEEERMKALRNEPLENQAAAFANKVFKKLVFPFYEYEANGITWLSATNGKYYGVEDLTDNEEGAALGTIFKQLYDNREEYLLNGKFRHYIELFASLIPYQTYVNNGWDNVARQLMVAYNDLNAKPNGFSDVYAIMNANNSYGATAVYDQILDFVSDEQQEAFILKQSLDNVSSYYWDASAGNINKSAVVWAYSFWGRRYNENPNTIEPIVSILQMLLNNYPQ